jgi:hypothetical protein
MYLAQVPYGTVRLGKSWEFPPRQVVRKPPGGCVVAARGEGTAQKWDVRQGQRRLQAKRGMRTRGPKWDGNRSGLSPRQKRESADKPGSVVGNHPSGAPVTVRLKRPTRKPLRAAGTSPKARALPYLVLLQVGFAVPPNVATGAVRSYRTVSPLPASRAPRMTHDRHRRFTFCCTFRGLAPPRRYLAPCPVEPGLSSASLDAAVAWPTPGAIIPSLAALLRRRLAPELQRVLIEFLAAPSRDLCGEPGSLRDG